MSIKHTIVFPIKYRLNKKRFSKQRTYSVQHIVEYDGNAIVYIPYPQTTNYQELVSEVIIQSTPHSPTQSIDIDENKLFAIDLQNNNSTKISITYTITVQPRSLVKTTASLSDYAKIQVDDTLLNATPCIDINSPQLKDFIDNLAIHESTPVLEASKTLYTAVIGKLTYGHAIEGLYTSQEAMSSTTVDCGGFSTLLIAAYRKLGIPARLVAGYWAGYSANDMHAWIEFMLPSGEWIPADPSAGQLSTQSRSYKSGEFGWVGSDRIAISTNSDFTTTLNDTVLSIPLLQTPFIVKNSTVTFINNHTITTSTV